MDTRMTEVERPAFLIVTSEFYKRANNYTAETAEIAERAEYQIIYL